LTQSSVGGSDPEARAPVRIAFTGRAFAIWAFVVPGWWWHSLSWVKDNERLVPIVAGIVGLSFALFAEGAVLRIPTWILKVIRWPWGSNGGSTQSSPYPLPGPEDLE
jgi:hypothetical protein